TPSHGVERANRQQQEQGLGIDRRIEQGVGGGRQEKNHRPRLLLPELEHRQPIQQGDRASERRKRDNGSSEQWMATEQGSAPTHQQRIQREEDHILMKKSRRVPAIADGGNLVVEVRIP